MLEVKAEGAGWRDEALSRRHRTWGFDCPAVDIDFLAIEYDNRQPKAIVDYKKQTVFSDRDFANFDTCASLYDKAGRNLPFFVTCYRQFPWRFTAWAYNESAQKFLHQQVKSLTERQWVELLYELRGRRVPLLNVHLGNSLVDMPIPEIRRAS